MNWRTLLVPHDFSPCADQALAAAADLARFHGATIVLLHVTHLPPGLTADAMLTDVASGELVRVDAYARDAANRELSRRGDNLRDAGVHVEVRTALGDVATQILNVAEDVRADVIVIGTHGRKGIAKFFIGSMAEKVLRSSPIPVLTVRQQTDVRRTTSDIVMPDLATD